MNNLRKFLFVDAVVPTNRPLFKSCAEIVRVYEANPNGVILTKRKVTSFMRGVRYSPKEIPLMKKGLSWSIDNKLREIPATNKIMWEKIHEEFSLVFETWENVIRRRAEEVKKVTGKKPEKPFLMNESYGNFFPVRNEATPQKTISDYVGDSTLSTPLLECDKLMGVAHEVFIFLPTLPHVLSPLIRDRIINSDGDAQVFRRTRVLTCSKNDAINFFDQYGIWFKGKKLLMAGENLEVRFTHSSNLGDDILIIGRPKRNAWWDEFGFRYIDGEISRHGEREKPYLPELQEAFRHAEIYAKPNLY